VLFAVLLMHYRIMVRDLGTGDIVVRRLLEVEMQSDLQVEDYLRLKYRNIHKMGEND
jgi:hypothetical protein